MNSTVDFFVNSNDTSLNAPFNKDNATSNFTELIIPYDERPETYFVPVLFFLIFVVGVVGNGTLVIIFLRHRTMRNVPNTYILSLALADLLVIVTSVPFTSIIYTLESWPWGVLICKLSETAKDISVGVSVFTLTALSADRFFAIVDPLKKFHTSSGGRRATRITLCIAISIWILAIVCAIPAAVGSHIKGVPEDNVQFVVCYPFPKDWLDGKYPKVMVLGKFFHTLRDTAGHHRGVLPQHGSLFDSQHEKRARRNAGECRDRARKKVAITVLIFVAVFAVCFAPMHAFMLFFYFHPRAQELYNAFWHYLRIVGFCLAYINSCANPVALYFLSGAFRKHFNRYLLCIKPNRPRCNTCQAQHATSMSLVSMKRNQSAMSRKGLGISINRRLDPAVTQETSVTLLGNGDHVCSKI
ncbi:hypothetical protein NQ317_007289 [Molorchus minor]|uniref:G-protein coupled receptors family 1 profile domain-containing protein n=1 Tax=Molorchus minor TaxID=1323400 RepID=A0ABQ9JVH3_9CUCU|nr:hypothetical protein NQ317_007289 [Molorchus minor]